MIIPASKVIQHLQDHFHPDTPVFLDQTDAESSGVDLNDEFGAGIRFLLMSDVLNEIEENS